MPKFILQFFSAAISFDICSQIETSVSRSVGLIFHRNLVFVANLEGDLKNIPFCHKQCRLLLSDVFVVHGINPQDTVPFICTCTQAPDACTTVVLRIVP